MGRAETEAPAEESLETRWGRGSSWPSCPELPPLLLPWALCGPLCSALAY